MIANGEGKTRADQRGESRQAKKWRLLALKDRANGGLSYERIVRQRHRFL